MRFLKDVRAAEFSEVALVLALVIVVAIGAYSLLGGNIAQIVTEVAGSL
jgi:Flp pilus assembly pilin Flp